MHMRYNLIVLGLLVAHLSSAQKYDHDLEWVHDLTPMSDTLVMDTVKLVANKVTVHEADESMVHSAWKSYFATNAISVDKSGDMLTATAARIGGDGPVDLKARMVRNKKLNSTDLVIHSSATDAVTASRSCQRIAVALNKWVVERQIEDVRKDLDKFDEKLADVRKDQTKASEKGEDLRGDLKKLQQKARKNAEKAEDLKTRIAEMQRKYDINKDPKLLSRIAKTQAALAKSEQKKLDLMEDQEKATRKIDKQAGDVPDLVEDKIKLQKDRDQVAQVLAALHAKLAAIH